MTWLLLLIFKAPLIFAQTLLVPEKGVPYTTYTEQCKKEGYQCTQPTFAEKLKAADTPEFNQLIEDFNLISVDFRKTLAARIENVVRNEMINLEQADILSNMIEKSFQFEKNTQLKYLQGELMELITRLKPLPEQDYQAKTYVVFKKHLTQKQLDSLPQTALTLFPIFVLSSDHLPRRKSEIEKSLITGRCDQYTLDEQVQEKYSISQTQPLFKEECSFQKSFTQSISSVKDGFVENKKAIFWISAAVGAILLMNKYQVEVTF